MVLVAVQKPAGLNPKSQSFSPNLKPGRDQCLNSAVRQEFQLTQAFCTIHVLNGLLDEAHPPQRGQSALWEAMDSHVSLIQTHLPDMLE